MWSFLSGTSWCYQLQQTSNIQFTLNFTSVHLIIQHHCKYRDYYGSKFRIRLSKCMYPGHIESKRKPRVRTVLLSALLQKRLFSNVKDSPFLGILVYQLHDLSSSIQMERVPKAPWRCMWSFLSGTSCYQV